MFVSKEFLLPTDRVLFVDDFISHGKTAMAFANLAADAGATMVAFLFLIEKAFERGRVRCVLPALRFSSLPASITVPCAASAFASGAFKGP
jgi:xanthine phosphoribosyltransferase